MTARNLLYVIRGLFHVMGYKQYFAGMHPEITLGGRTKVIMAVGDEKKARRLFTDKFGDRPHRVDKYRCLGRPVIRKSKVTL